MDTLRTWVLLLSGTAVLSALAGAMVPQGANRQAFRVLCAAALLYALVLPLRGKSVDRMTFDLLPGQTQAAAFEEKTQDAATLAAQAALQTALENKLQQAGQSAVRVQVRCARFDDGIAPARITLRGSADKAAMEALLQPFLTAHTVWTLEPEERDEDGND